MYIVENCISDSLYNECISEICNYEHKNIWKSSSLSWNNNVKKGVTGTCLTAEPSEHISLKIKKEVIDYLPKKISNITVFYCIWLQNSGISMHNDGDYKFGATIYLNPNWDVNCGGLFLWQENNLNKKETKMWNAIVPTCKTLVVNDKKEYHLVTSISPLSPSYRYTIQIWDV